MLLVPVDHPRDTVLTLTSGQLRDVLHRGPGGRSLPDPDCVNVVVTNGSISDRAIDHKTYQVLSFLRQR